MFDYLVRKVFGFFFLLYYYYYYFGQQSVLQTSLITFVSRSLNTIMFAHVKRVILGMRLLSLPASLTVLETASLIYPELAALKIASLCKV